MPKPEFATTPFEVIVDTREGAPFRFKHIRADADLGHVPLVVKIREQMLRCGDYSVAGLEDQFVVERKSRDDAFSTFISERSTRGMSQLSRLAELPQAFVVIECSWGALALGPERAGMSPQDSRKQGKSLVRSILAWQVRYPSIHWLPCDSRGLAEVVTFRILERWWKEHNEK